SGRAVPRRRGESGSGRPVPRQAQAARRREPIKGADAGAPVPLIDINPIGPLFMPEGSAQERQRVVRARVAVAAEEQQTLPLAETKTATVERDLLRARTQQSEQHPLAIGAGARHEALEERLDVAEEAGFALADPHERSWDGGGDVGDSAP